MAKVVGNPGLQSLEQGEIEDGHDLEWFTVQEVEDVMSKDKADDYEHRFIQLRDKSIFEFYKNKLQELKNS